MDNVERVQSFFDLNLKVKQNINKVFPNSMDLSTPEAMFDYQDQVRKALEKIEYYLLRLMKEFNVPTNVTNRFINKMDYLIKTVDSSNFLNMMRTGDNAVFAFISKEISNMRPEFVESVNKGFLGYYVRYGHGVMEPTTVNEYLHYVHSYVVNHQSFYEDVPIVDRVPLFDNTDYCYANLRGVDNDLGRRLMNAMRENGVDSGVIDIINLENRILIMARDLGHAAVIDIDLSTETPFVKYFIPKNCNPEKMSMLRGVIGPNKSYATGDFQVSKDSLVEELTTFMNMIPTDSDIPLYTSHIAM